MQNLIKTFKEKIGSEIKMLRIKRNLTQEEVAAGILSLRAYQKIETGASNARVESICIIALRLGIHPRDLFDFPIAKETLRHHMRAKKVRDKASKSKR